MNSKIFIWLLMAGVILTSSSVLAQEVQQPKAGPTAKAVPSYQEEKTVTPELDPLQILQKMCDFLKAQQQFSYKAEVADDQVYAGGKKLQYGIEIETFVRRPDRLRVNAEGDLVEKQFYFDGKTITLFDKNENVYGTIEVPPDIESALEKASKEFGVRVGLTDLASPQLFELIRPKVKHSLYVGLHKVRGVPCHHLAFDGDEVQLQLWIDAADTPLPRKVVLNHKNLPASPQWTAYLSDWNFTAQLNDNLFAFTPPQGAEKIKFIPMQAGQAPKTKSKQSKKGGKS